MLILGMNIWKCLTSPACPMKLIFISYGFQDKGIISWIGLIVSSEAPGKKPVHGALMKLMKPYQDVWWLLAVSDRLEFLASNFCQYTSCSGGTYRIRKDFRWPTSSRYQFWMYCCCICHILGSLLHKNWIDTTRISGSGKFRNYDFATVFILS